MRQLTASQKIAILENRVAQLEKQAMLEGLKAKIVDAMSPFKRLFPHTKKIIKDTRKSPKQIAQEYMKVRKDPNFKKAMKQLQREAGPSPVKQVAYVIDAYESGELEARPRTASMRRRGGFLLGMTFATGLSAAIMATLYILDIGIQWVLGKAKGLFKRGSMDKEAIYLPALFMAAFFLVNIFGLTHIAILAPRARKKAASTFIKQILSPYVKDIKIGNVILIKGDWQFESYVFLNGEEYRAVVSVFENSTAQLEIGGRFIYQDRMDPLLLNSRNKSDIQYGLRGLGVI